MSSVRTAICLICVVSCLGGCFSYDSLEPRGVGKTSTIGRPNPYPYRAMAIRATQDHNVRILINAFRPRDYGLGSTTIFLAVADHCNYLEGNQVAGYGSRSPEMRKPHLLAFPNGRTLTVVLEDGRTFSGDLAPVNYDQFVYKFALPLASEAFTATFPDVELDGERIEIGKVAFQMTDSIYYATC